MQTTTRFSVKGKLTARRPVHWILCLLYVFASAVGNNGIWIFLAGVHVGIRFYGKTKVGCVSILLMVVWELAKQNEIEGYATSCICEHCRHGKGVCYDLGRTWMNGRTVVVIINGNLNFWRFPCQMNISIFISTGHEHHLPFQQDNARPHVVRIVTEKLSLNCHSLLFFPDQLEVQFYMYIQRAQITCYRTKYLLDHLPE